MSNRAIERASGQGGSSSPVYVIPLPSSVATRTNVAANLATVTLLAADAGRLGATIFNDTETGSLYLALGSGATSSDFTVRVGPQEYYEVPASFVGVVSGVWDLADGSARITQLTG